ncbi:type II toxin-antitoxin system VapC family toxin [Azonexus sp.]|uniref:type II toxin-antitoxin system VapC family toxin n=1 Tax=Azonexus sp. TaxID=1872668 RepID=UPI0039E62933
MGSRYLLDTNICIYIAKTRPPSVAKRFALLAPQTVKMSLITYGELCFGAEKSSQREAALGKLARLVEWIPVLPLDAAVGEAYGSLRRQLQSAGTLIGNNDLWIAAHALALGMTLVSNNVREFQRVPGLHLENWVS